MFTGRHDHVLDEKGRTSLPKDFRKLFEEGETEAPWIIALPNCLAILTHEMFQKLSTGLTDMGLLVEQVQKVRRMMIGQAMRCEVDKQGRILIPPHLRDWAALDRSIVFMGVGDHIEVWNLQLLQRDLHATRDHYPECSQVVERLRNPGGMPS